MRYVSKEDCAICNGSGLIGIRFPTFYSPDDTNIEPCECVIELGKCCYKDCSDDATTEGFILVRNPYGGRDILTKVQSCDKHKNVPGFI